MVAVAVAAVSGRPNVDRESAPGFVSICVRGLVEDMMATGREVMTGQKRGHHVLDLNIVLRKKKKESDLKTKASS